MRPDRMLARLALLLLWLSALGASAFAQSATCRALQNQLASLGRGGGVRAGAYADAAQRQIDEMQRISAYMRQIGCGAPRLFVFGPAPPAQCGDLAYRLSRMQANLASLQGQAEQLGLGTDMAARRDRLREAIRQYCSVDPRQQALPPLDQPALDPEPGMADTQDPGDIPLSEEPSVGAGVGKPVCVRLCDGYFFPLTNLGRRGREGAPEMCQAQCPGSETEAFALGPDDDISRAVGQGGKSYMELDNALRYQKATVPGCSCRKSDESWGQTLKGAEDMLDGPEAPISAEEAERLSRLPAPTAPKKGAAPAGSAKGQQAPATPSPPSGSAAAAKPATPDPLQPSPAAPDGRRKVRIITPEPPKPQ